MTSKEFAKIIGVSQSTVSRALNDSPLVPDEKKKYIQKCAEEMGFVLNSQARSLKTNRTGTIGILFPKHFKGMNSNLMLAHIYDNIQLELNKHGYDVMVIYNTNSDEGISVFERTVRRRKIDGVIVLRLDFSKRELELVHDSKIPCVLMMNADRADVGISYCLSDSEYGGYLVGKYFGKYKDYKIMHLSIHEEIRDASKRLIGFKKGLDEHGIKIDDDDIKYCDLSIASAYDYIMKNANLFNEGKVALFAYNDMIAIGAVNALNHLGKKIPEDVQVIGMDDIPLATSIFPAISTIHVQVDDMVSTVCSLIIEKIENPKKSNYVKKIIKPRLIIRETTF